ncbi:hypothetical protein [Haladaptatus halobius]|uniref:hypothetical protein n=1 Tax=Haladaptatus halobius TaxID=2884875 RepID=UPI001D0B61EF|nr:hypothetical protein [Haladaptatus halobius]
MIGVPGIRDHEIGIPPFGKLRTLSATAISDGLASEEVRDYLTEMGFDLSKYAPIAERVIGPYHISEKTAQAIRLEYAGALRADVELLRDAFRVPNPQVAIEINTGMSHCNSESADRTSKTTASGELLSIEILTIKRLCPISLPVICTLEGVE